MKGFYLFLGIVTCTFFAYATTVGLSYSDAWSSGSWDPHGRGRQTRRSGQGHGHYYSSGHYHK